MYSLLKAATRTLIAVACCVTVLQAGPKIKVDSVDWNAGVIKEGEVKVLKHTFIVKNTGDSILVIQQVRPG